MQKEASIVILIMYEESIGSNRRRGYILCDKHCAVMGVDWCKTILRCVLLPTKSMDRQRSSLPERVMAVGAFRS